LLEDSPVAGSACVTKVRLLAWKFMPIIEVEGDLPFLDLEVDVWALAFI